MKLPFWESDTPSGAILGPALDDALNELCERHQLLLLATPYLQVESRFQERRGEELLLRTSMGPEAVKHTFGSVPLRLRFPWALTFYGGPTRILGYGLEEGRRVLRARVPGHMVLDEQRKAFRIERVGRSTGALGSEDGNLVRITLENISTLGAGVFCMETALAEGLQAGRLVDLSLTLEQGFTLVAGARVCHSEGPSLGLQFQPPLTGRNLQLLGEWLAPRTEEARRHWENRAQLRARAERLARPKAAPSGTLLLSDDDTLAEEVSAALDEIQPLRRVPAALAPVKEALAEPPLIILVDAANRDMESRYRLRTILETLKPAAPVIVLGRAEDPRPGRQLATELKTGAYFDWAPRRGPLFQRLARGLIRHHRKDEDT